MADTETTPSDSSAADLLPEATRRLIRTADELDETAYAGPSLLPGWSRAHVLAHLALNAEGLAGALAGIVEGRAVSMYASQEARDGDIEGLAGQDPAAIRTRLLGASTDLTDAMAAIPPDAWQTTIERVPGGPVFPASAVADMRLREVEIHHVDLAAAYDRADWPAAFAARLVDGALARRRAAQDGEPGFSVHATDLDRSWDDDGTGPAVAGTAADLGWWLTGRGRGEGLT
ncbi:maleylpyruvate isomerase family mycothiol-dependent enzyme, partial [Nocardioides sp.]|uniref:maleylpyruvate isomerase family mycothiol-dependent enzyme n=1 Tax=Nocardioides sp. TaxID=35761 RepID=UPI002EDA0117